VPEELSIFEAIRRREYSASLVTTFNAYFPFYEEVVLRHLNAAGCQYNVVLMDAGQCGQALAHAELRPRLAGKGYALLPIKCGGAFHPKLILLVGRQHGLLLVGSHNLTLSGFSFNRELTNCFEYAGDKDRALLPIFHGALKFIKAWAATLPEPLREAVKSMARFAPWLQEPQERLEADAESHFFGSEPNGRSLWEMVRERVPGRVKRITVVGPFYDRKLTFIKRLGEEFAPKHLVVGLEPEKTVIAAEARQFVPQAKFVDASSLHDGSGYLHAKAILFEAEQGEELLVTGSANPTHPAWLAPHASRNAEAVILRRSGRKDSLGRALGLSGLAAQPPLTASDWERLNKNKALPAGVADGAHPPLIACEAEDGFEIYGIIAGRPLAFSRATLLDVNGGALGESSTSRFDGDKLCLAVSDSAAVSLARMLELRTDDGDTAYAIVHHTAELADAAQTDLQREFKRALASPDSEAPIELLKLIEKVIADDTANGSFERPASRTSGGNQSDENAEITSLVADSSQTKASKRRRRPLATGDLALILGVLIHRLGQGLPSPLVGHLIIKRSEEELKEDENEEPDLSAEIDGAAILKTCHRRVRSLFRRMTGQLALAAEGGSNPLRALLHLTAVLGLTQHLTNCVNHAAWVPQGERIVPPDAQWEFFLDACRYLYARNHGVMKAALQEAGAAAAESCTEASAVRGLLLWLAWDCGLDVRTVLEDDDPDILWENLYGLEQLMHLTADVSEDEEAAGKARAALSQSAASHKAEGWLQAQLRWGARVAALNGDLRNAPSLAREPVRGDLVFLSKVATPSLTVVLNVEGDKLTLACDETKKFKSAYVTVVDLSPARPA
jgi:hypothetical protein